jgi:glycosyltransferase 2 family protein
MANKKFPWSLIIRFVVTAAVLLFVYISNRDGWPEFRSNLEHSQFFWLLAAFACYAITNLLGVWRWYILLKNCDSYMPLRKTFQLVMIGLFTNNFLPGAMSGDVVKGFYASKEKPDKKPTVIMSIVMERLLGFGAMFIVSTALILNRYDKLCATPLTNISVHIYLALFVIGMLVLAITKWTSISRIFPFWRKLPFQSWLTEAGQAYRGFIQHPACFWGGMILSAFAHLFLILTFYFVSMALTMNLNFFDLAAVLPFIAILTIIPATINGFGIREVAFQQFLLFVGMTKTSSTALSLCGGFIIILFGLLGGPIYLRYKSPPANANGEPRN